jgi:hypothetical protein
MVPESDHASDSRPSVLAKPLQDHRRLIQSIRLR